MDKFWQIVKHEYTKHVFNKRFIWTVLGMPLAIIGMIGLVLLIGLFVVDRSPIGYVDPAGVITPEAINQLEGNFFEPVLPMLAFETQEEADAQLRKDEIQAYIVLAADFETSRDARVYYTGNLGSEANGQIYQVLQSSSFSDKNIPNLTRINEGTNYLLQAADGSRQMRNDEWANFVLPFVMGIVFMIVVMTSGGYLLQAVVEEKENRTMEIMVTSVSPMQLMAGKIVGNLAVGLTQLLIWVLFLWLGLTIAGKFFPFAANLNLSSEYMLISIALMLPAFVFVAAMMATLGATVTESREAQQVSGLFTLPVMLPYYFFSTFLTNPNGPIARFLSYFPMSAPLATTIRMAFTVVPTWEILMIFGILIVFSIFTVWLAGRAFRLGMLSYGKKISFRQIFKKEVSRV